MGNDYTQTIAFSSDDSSTELNRSKGGEGGLILMVMGVANILVHINNTAIPSSKNLFLFTQKNIFFNAQALHVHW